MFDIEFISPETFSEGVLARRGQITLGDFVEEFESPIGFLDFFAV